MAPFFGWGSTASRLEPLWGGSLLFTTKFPEIPGTHFIDLGRMKGWVDLGTTQWFWTQDPWIGNPAPSALSHTPAKIGGYRHCVSGDIMVLVYHVISQGPPDQMVE